MRIPCLRLPLPGDPRPTARERGPPRAGNHSSTRHIRATLPTTPLQGQHMSFKPNPFLSTLGAAQPVGFDVVHHDVAVQIIKERRIRRTVDLLGGGHPVVGDPEFLHHRLRQPMPTPFAGCVGEFVPLSVTPATRAAYATNTGYKATAIPRADLVVIAVDIEELSRYGLRPLVTDRSPLTAGCTISDELGSLEGVPWHRIHARQFSRSGPDSRGYDTEILVWGCVPLTGTARVICPDAASRKRFAAEAEAAGTAVKIVERPDAFF